MTNSVDSPIVVYGSRLLSPYILLFGLYVIFHGHYSPGGGFQGGTLLAASVLLIRISSGQDIERIHFSSAFTSPLAVAGVFIYFLTGLTAIFLGAEFLNYEFLPFGDMPAAELRYWGILVIEVGIGFTVMGILVALYDNLIRGEDYD